MEKLFLKKWICFLVFVEDVQKEMNVWRATIIRIYCSICFDPFRFRHSYGLPLSSRSKVSLQLKIEVLFKFYKNSEDISICTDSLGALFSWVTLKFGGTYACARYILLNRFNFILGSGPTGIYVGPQKIASNHAFYSRVRGRRNYSE